MTDLSMIRGDDGTFELALLSSDGLALDLTDATEITFTVGHLDAGPLFSKTLGAGVVIGDAESGSGSDPLDGVIEVTVAAADTSGLPPFPITYEYAVRVLWADGSVSTRARGRFRVLPTPVPV